MLEERVIELETKISYQEDLIQELNKVVADQEKRLTSNEEKMDILIEKLKDMMDQLEEAPVNQKPPHY